MSTDKDIILIADDDMFIRQIVTKALSDIFEVVEVADGQEVTAAYKQHAPKAIFLDLHLPGISGMDLISEIVAQDNNANILMLTSDSTVENVEKAKSFGVKGFISKPFDKKTLLDNLKRCGVLY
jgi:two-component system chemotaxis response regulator CheY